MDASRNFMGGIHFVLAWILLLFIVIDIVSNCFRAAPRNSARSLRQDFCPNSKFGKRRNTVCI